MIFFNDKKLALRFKNNEVSSKERFNYLLMFFILIFIFYTFSNIDKYEWDIYVETVDFLIAVIGLFFVYNTNKAGDDHYFIDRLICLSSVVINKTSIFFFIFMVIISLSFPLFGFDYNYFSDSYKNIIFLFLSIIFDIYIFWRLNSLIKIAAY